MPGPASTPCCSCQLFNALGEAHTRAGEYLLAQEAFEQAVRLALEAGCASELARAALGYETASWCPGMPGVAAARLLREALNATGTDDLALMARLLSALARALIFSGEEEQAMKVYEQALAMARRSGDPLILASTLVATLTRALAARAHLRAHRQRRRRRLRSPQPRATGR